MKKGKNITPEFDTLLKEMLTPTQYICYKYYYFENMTETEISKKLNICISCVSSHLSASKRKLAPIEKYITSIYKKINGTSPKNKYFDADRTGKKLREIRKEKKLTQKEASELLGIDIRTLQGIEKGNSNMKVSYLVALANLYNVSINQILGR